MELLVRYRVAIMSEMFLVQAKKCFSHILILIELSSPEGWIELYDYFAHGHRERLWMGREYQDKGKG